jgi:hypothetical protein
VLLFAAFQGVQSARPQWPALRAPDQSDRNADEEPTSNGNDSA